MAKSNQKNNSTVEKVEAKETNVKENKAKETNVKVVAIPVNPLNKKDDKVKVIINGKETVIKRGVQQKVSNEVYERLVIAGYVIEG